jgi:hypothetical protein
VVESDTGHASWLKVGTQTLACYILDYYAEKQLLDASAVSLGFQGSTITKTGQNCAALGIGNLSTVIINVPASARKQNQIDLQTSCCGDEDPNIPIESIIPLTTFKRLFELLFHPSLCQPLQKDSVYLLCNVIRTLSLNCGYAALMSVLTHPQLPVFVEIISLCNDPSLQESVAVMINSIFLQAKKFCATNPEVFEGTSMPTPHPLSRYFGLIRDIIVEVLDEIRACSILSDAYFSLRLPFLVSLLMPRARTEAKLEVDFHQHMLPLSTQVSNWTCDSCQTLYQSEPQIRYRCTTCDFDVCGQCVVFQVPDMPYDIIDASQVCELFSFVEAIVVQTMTPIQIQSVCALLTLARTVDPEIIATNSSFWNALPSLMNSANRVLEMHTRCLIRGLLVNPVVMNVSRRSLLRALNVLVNSKRAKQIDSKLASDLVKMTVDSFIIDSSVTAWVPQDIKLLLQSLVQVFVPYLQKQEPTSQFQQIQTGFCTILSMVVQRDVLSQWKSLLWGNISEANIVYEVTFLISVLSQWEVEQGCLDQVVTKPNAFATWSAKTLKKSSAHPLPGFSALKYMAGELSDYDFLDFAGSDPFPLAVGGQSAHKPAAARKAAPAAAVCSNVRSVLIHALYSMIEKLDLGDECLHIIVRYLRQSSIPFGNSALLLLCSLLIANFPGISSQFMRQSDLGISFLLRELSRSVEGKHTLAPFKQTVVLGSGCKRDTVDLGHKPTGSFSAQILHVIASLSRSADVRMTEFLDLTTLSSDNAASAVSLSGSGSSSKPPISDFLSVIISFIEKYPEDVKEICRAVAIENKQACQYVIHRLTCPPYSDQRMSVLYELVQDPRIAQTSHASLWLSETVLAESDLSQPGYHRIINIISSLWSHELLSTNPIGFSKLLPSLMRLVTHCSMQLAQFDVAEAEEILMHVSIPFDRSTIPAVKGASEAASSTAKKTLPKVGDRIRLLVPWKFHQKLSLSTPSAIDVGSEGTLTASGVTFDNHPGKVCRRCI